MKPLVTALGIAVVLAVAGITNAAVWNGDDPWSDLWSSGDNWVGDSSPGAGEAVTITDNTNGSTSIFDSSMTVSSFGAFTVGGGMTLQVDKTNIAFDSCSVTGSWTHANTSGNYGISITDANGGSGQMSLDTTSATITVNASLTTSAHSLVLDADTANASRTLTKAGSGTLVIEDGSNTGDIQLIGDADNANHATYQHSAGSLSFDLMDCDGDTDSSDGHAKINIDASVDVTSGGAEADIDGIGYVDCDVASGAKFKVNDVVIGDTSGTHGYVTKLSAGSVSASSMRIEGGSGTDTTVTVSAGTIVTR